MDDLGYWSRALSACEIKDLYHSQLGSQNTYSNLTLSAIDSYTWPVNNQTYTQSGIYSDTLVNSVGYDSVITLNLTLEFTGLNEFYKTNILISPNPITNQFSISGTEQIVSLTLLDMNGKSFRSFNEKENSHDVANLKPGVYLLEVLTEHEKFIARVIKE
jgi:hypothetical protein